VIPPAVEQALLGALSTSGREWLARARANVAAHPLRAVFPAAGRCAGRAPLASPVAAPGGPLFVWTTDDAARGVLLDALGPAADSELDELYRHGNAAERRAVLRWLGLLPDESPLAAAAVEIVEDALRSNDPRLVAAALGPWAVGSSAGAVVQPGRHRRDLAALLTEFGTERMIVNSAADWGRSDPLKVARTAEAMLAAGFSTDDVDRVVWHNPVEIFSQSGRLELDEPDSDPAATFAGNSILRGSRPGEDG
jgi:hypothetical protein